MIWSWNANVGASSSCALCAPTNQGLIGSLMNLGLMEEVQLLLKLRRDTVSQGISILACLCGGMRRGSNYPLLKQRVCNMAGCSSKELSGCVHKNAEWICGHHCHCNGYQCLTSPAWPTTLPLDNTFLSRDMPGVSEFRGRLLEQKKPAYVISHEITWTA
jgi:hypothetical protein